MAKNEPADGAEVPALNSRDPESIGNGMHSAPPAPQPAAAPDSAEWLRVTLSCIGDGVITTDRDGRVTFINSVAQALTGWTQEEALQGGGASIDRVFHIINEETRAQGNNPALRALRDGVIVGLANHSILVAKGGTEVPIDDSAAPIRNAHGETSGAVLVFRDITERKRHEKEAQDAREFAENILATQREPFLVLDKTLRVVSANHAFYKAFRVEKEATEGRFVYDLGDGQWNIPKLRELLENVLERNSAFEGFEVAHDFPAGVGRKIMLLNLRRIIRPGNHSELVLVAIEDVTERRQAQTLLASQKEVLELAAGGAPLPEVLDLVVRSAQRHSGEQSRATLCIVDADCTHLRFAASAGMPESYTRAVDTFEIGPSSPWCGTAAFTGQAVIVADVTSDPRWADFRDLARDHDVRACWAHPIRTIGGKVMGTIAVYHRTPCEPGPGDLDAIRLLCHTTAVILERHTELEKRQQLEAAHQDSELRYRRVFESAKDGILILDAHTGQITDANAFMCGLTGMGKEELVGKELHEIGMFKDVDENKAAFRELQRTGYLRHEHLPLKNRNGDCVEVEFIANVYNEAQKLVAQCNVRDISERSRLEKQVAKQSEALAAQSRAKDEFLAMLSHELRNPLAPIRSAVHLLRLQERGGGNPIQQQAREIIERQVATLTKMVSDLSEVSRVVSGRIRLDLKPMDLKQVLGHALQTVAPMLELRKHSVSVSLCSEPVWTQSDSTRIEEVLVNLLNNAGKYTPDGGRIEVSCEHLVEKGQNHALIRVRDNGVGIDKELLPRIFDLFTQADRSLARSEGGLGIGLSLASRLVNLHAGSIWAHSQGPGKGSEFTMKLPLIPTPLVRPAPVEPAAGVEGTRPQGTADADLTGEGIRVLVVDDNVDLVTMLAGALRYKGYSVQSAYTGPDGLRIAQQWRPDIALLDIGLPGLDGYEVARRLRADPVLVTVPGPDGVVTGTEVRMKLIAITGYGQESDVALAMEAGFDGHMVKPCDFDELEKMMAAPPTRK